MLFSSVEDSTVHPNYANTGRRDYSDTSPQPHLITNHIINTMGFIVPKYKAPAAPAAPDPTPQEEQVENNTFDILSEKRKKRKGMEATLLSSGEQTAATSTASSNNSSTGSGSSQSEHTSPSSGIDMNRKTLG